VINLVCDRALTAAFSARAREVTPALVKVAIRTLAGERRARRWRGARPLWRAVPVAATILGLLLLGGAVATGYRSVWRPSSPPLSSRHHERPRPPAARPVAVTSDVVAMAPPPPSAAAAAPAEPLAPGSDGWRALLTQALGFWGVKEGLSEQAVKAWPTSAGGGPDVPAVAERYHLAATRLGDIDVADLRAVGLPAIVEVNDRSGPRPLLVRRFEGHTAVLTAPTGEEARVTLDSLDASWTRSAWIIWNNVDHIDSTQGMTPAVVGALAARLQALGYLTPPLPSRNTERLQEAVRRFQSAAGLRPDGVAGPRTILALSRVSAGPVSPNIVTAR
jgi:general secretion pathway protein A